jgi:hypothetical protein
MQPPRHPRSFAAGKHQPFRSLFKAVTPTCHQNEVIPFAREVLGKRHTDFC